jgi:hypothetical protein
MLILELAAQVAVVTQRRQAELLELLVLVAVVVAGLTTFHTHQAATAVQGL